MWVSVLNLWWVISTSSRLIGTWRCALNVPLFVHHKFSPSYASAAFHAYFFLILINLQTIAWINFVLLRKLWCLSSHIYPETCFRFIFATETIKLHSVLRPCVRTTTSHAMKCYPSVNYVLWCTINDAQCILMMMFQVATRVIDLKTSVVLCSLITSMSSTINYCMTNQIPCIIDCAHMVSIARL